MARARSAGTVIVTSVALCVGLATLAACAGVEVDEHASPATTELYQATGRARSSTETGTSSTPGSTPGTTGTGLAGPSSSATATAVPPGTSTSPTPGEAPGTSTAGGGDTGDVAQPDEPFGFGQGTTGGAGGPTVTVSSSPALVEAAAGDEPLVIEVAGTVALDGMVPVGSNKTVVGVARTDGAAGAAGSVEPAELVGGGLHIDAAENVIVQDLAISGSAGDDIDVDGATDVWIDHNDLSAAADGALDIGGGSDRVTVSWNHFHDQDQTTRVGHGDGPAAPDTDQLRVTYHHNWFQGTARHNPSVRLGHPVHVVNNHFSDIPGGGEGVTSSDDAGVLVEANAFENVADPFHPGAGTSAGADDPSAGSLVARDNHLEASGEGRTGGTVLPLPYASTPDPATSVEAAVTTGAGPRPRPLPDGAGEAHDGGVAG